MRNADPGVIAVRTNCRRHSNTNHADIHRLYRTRGTGRSVIACGTRPKLVRTNSAIETNVAASVKARPRMTVSATAKSYHPGSPCSFSFR